MRARVDQATERMIIRAAPARCFEVVTDFERYPEWAADIKAVQVFERDGSGGIGHQPQGQRDAHQGAQACFGFGTPFLVGCFCYFTALKGFIKVQQFL